MLKLVPQGYIKTYTQRSQLGTHTHTHTHVFYLHAAFLKAFENYRSDHFAFVRYQHKNHKLIGVRCGYLSISDSSHQAVLPRGLLSLILKGFQGEALHYFLLYSKCPARSLAYRRNAIKSAERIDS